MRQSRRLGGGLEQGLVLAHCFFDFGVVGQQLGRRLIVAQYLARGLALGAGIVGAVLRDQARGLIAAGCGPVVLACTEIPLALAASGENLGDPFLDATRALAEACVAASRAPEGRVAGCRVAGCLAA